MGLKKLTRKIENHYARYRVFIKLKLISEIENSKRFLFRFKIKHGTKVETIFSCAPDVKVALQIALFQPFWEGENICLVVSKEIVNENSLYKMLKSQIFHTSKAILPLALGYNIIGSMVFDDLAEMPHMMYAGTTNSGKSIGLICLILSLIVKQSVRKANLIIFDTGANKMGVFNGIPHLSHSVVNDIQTGVYVIGKLVEEMERRKKLEDSGLQMQPAIICIIDEFIAFIDHSGNKKQSYEITHAISDLLRRGRHAKIYMVLSAQNPTDDNMRKLDISNVTSRVAFRCAKYQNSMTILGEGGAEKLTGEGTALYMSRNYSHPIYLQGAYMSEEEVKKLITCVKSIEYDLSNKFLIPEFEVSALPVLTNGNLDYILNEGDRKELAEIIMWTIKQSTISSKRIKEKFCMGNRSNDIIEEMCAMRIISEKNAKQPRKVLPQSVDDMPKEVMSLLIDNGFSEEIIVDAIGNRK